MHEAVDAQLPLLFRTRIPLVGAVSVVIFCDGSLGASGWRVEVNGVPVAQGGVVSTGTSNTAEYEGLISALEWLKKNRRLGAEVRSDSKLALEQIAGRWRTNVEHLVPLRDRARKLVRETGALLVQVPSSRNEAHVVARAARPKAMERAQQLALFKA